MFKKLECDTNRPPKYKVELHVHLDGAVRPKTIWELAQKKGIDLKFKTLEQLSEACRVKCPTVLKDFLKCFDVFMPVIVGDAEALERISYEFCEDAANQGVLYVEVRHCPHLLSTTHGVTKGCFSKPLTPREVVMCVNKGLQRGAQDFNITVRTILCCFRSHPEWSEEILQLCVEFARQGVVGIDIAGDEANYLASSKDIEVFQRAAELGIHRTVHGGEAGPAENVQKALTELHAERIGHGYHVLDNSAIYEDCRKKRVHFETCGYSSFYTGSVPVSVKKHPIARFAEDGTSFSINRDDPTITQKTLDEEYEYLRGFGLSNQNIIKANLEAAHNCFLAPDEKELLIQRLTAIHKSSNDLPLPGTIEYPYIPLKDIF